jgi:nudix-type nucleoside diphosphatase (YffH/AdpP family)
VSPGPHQRRGPNPIVRDIRIETLSNEEHLLRRARYELQQRNGRWDEVSHEAYDPGDATAALVIDPSRATVLLVRQYRVPAHLNGHPDGMLLEVPAGKIDEGETPEATMRRELVEELGHRIEDLDLRFCLYSSPGSVTERLWLFTGEYGAATKVAPGGGENAESERLDIVELTLDDALEMLLGERIVDMKTVVLLQWMQYHQANITDVAPRRRFRPR